MRALSIKITDQEINLAQQMFNLGFEVGCGKRNYDYELYAYMIKRILSKVDNDKTMISFLQQIFESGISVGRRRMQNEMESCLAL